MTTTNIYEELQTLKFEESCILQEEYHKFTMKKPELKFREEPAPPPIKVSWFQGIKPIAVGCLIVFIASLTVGEVLAPILFAFIDILLPPAFLILVWKNHKDNIEKMSQSPEYLKQVELSRQAYLADCELVKASYDVKRKCYEDALNEYKTRKALWEKEQLTKLNSIRSRIAKIEDEITASILNEEASKYASQ